MYRGGGDSVLDLFDDMVGLVVEHLIPAQRLNLPVALRRAHRHAAEPVLLRKTCLHRYC